MIEFVDALLWEHKTSTQLTDYTLLQLDLVKAYDSMRHQALLDTLAELGLPVDFSTLVADSLTGLTGRIWLDTGLSPQFRVRRGIRQGCPLSPLLFAIALGLKMRVATHAAFGHTLSVTSIEVPSHLEYADDITLLTQPRGMQ